MALDAGFDHFRLVSRDTEPTTFYSGFSHFGFGYGHYGGPLFGSSLGINDARPSTRYRAVAEIQVGPDVGAEGADIYDARELKSRLDGAGVAPGHLITSTVRW